MAMEDHVGGNLVPCYAVQTSNFLASFALFASALCIVYMSVCKQSWPDPSV